MALKLDQIRALADRVAESHGLDVVDVEYQGGGKHRTLRVFIEKNEAARTRLRDRVAVLRAEREKTGEHISAQAGLIDKSDNVPEDALAEEGAEQECEPGAEEDQDAGLDVDQDLDEAFLEGLPSVENLEFLSGITHGDCELFSRDFGTVLEVEELAPGTEYLLEISSPGLDRRMTGAANYRRFTGSLVKVQTFEAVAGSRHWQGRIAEMYGDMVVLELGGKPPGKKLKKGAALEPERVEIKLGNVEKAQLVPEF